MKNAPKPSFREVVLRMVYRARLKEVNWPAQVAPLHRTCQNVLMAIGPIESFAIVADPNG
jgi:hypothetical protein